MRQLVNYQHGVPPHQASGGDNRPRETKRTFLCRQHQGGGLVWGRERHSAAEEENLLPRLGPLLRFAYSLWQEDADHHNGSPGGGFYCSCRWSNRRDGGFGARVCGRRKWQCSETSGELQPGPTWLMIDTWLVVIAEDVMICVHCRVCWQSLKAFHNNPSFLHLCVHCMGYLNCIPITCDLFSSVNFTQFAEPQNGLVEYCFRGNCIPVMATGRPIIPYSLYFQLAPITACIIIYGVS